MVFKGLITSRLLSAPVSLDKKGVPTTMHVPLPAWSSCLGLFCSCYHFFSLAFSGAFLTLEIPLVWSVGTSYSPSAITRMLIVVRPMPIWWGLGVILMESLGIVSLFRIFVQHLGWFVLFRLCINNSSGRRLESCKSPSGIQTWIWCI